MASMIENEKGFTLIEVIVAMMILTIGILAMMTMQLKSITTDYRASTMAQASSVAAGQIERFRMMDYGDAVFAAGNHPPITVPAPDPITNYPISWTVTDDSPVNGTKRIAVTVSVPNNGPTVTYEYIKQSNI